MRRALGAGLLTAALVIASAAAAAAQTDRDPFRPRSFEISAGGMLMGGNALGSATATLTRNQSPASAFPLFETDTELAGAAGFEGRVGFHVTRGLAAEGAFLFSRPTLETRITSDAESAPATTATSALEQYLAEGSVVYHLHRWTLAGGVPFVLGGAGYLRQLHEDRAVVETGQAYHAGGGLKFVFGRRARGWIRAFGVRVDGRVYVLRGGADLSDGDDARTTGAGSASVVVLF